MAVSTFRRRFNGLAPTETVLGVGEAGDRFIALAQPARRVQVDAGEIEVVLPESMTLPLRAWSARTTSP